MGRTEESIASYEKVKQRKAARTRKREKVNKGEHEVTHGGASGKRESYVTLSSSSSARTWLSVLCYYEIFSWN